jgi:nitrite reductase (NO-forming)
MQAIARIPVLLIIAILLAGCAGGPGPAWTNVPAASEDPGQVAGPGRPGDHSAPPAAPTGEVLGTIEVRAFDLGFEPAAINVAEPGRYAVTFVNEGQIFHDVTFDDGTMIDAEAGVTAEGEVTVPEGGIGFICSVPGHADGGMRGEVTVGGEPALDDHGGPLPIGDIEPDENAPAPVTYDPAAPARLQGKVHDVELVITEREMTIAPGYVQRVWTFGDTVPGPVIRVKVGDTVRIHLKNPATNELPHSIDFHSSMVAWNDEMTSIAPGEEKVYEWTADYAGVWMYHCGTTPALHHIANGMYGMVIVEPPEGLPPVDHEYALVQSEWYLGEQGEPAELAKASAAAAAPDLVLFNGVANQYKDAPIEVGTGKRVRVFVLNAGPSVDSSFHVVGTIFDSVIKEGAPDSQPGWGAQSVDLAPAQGAIVEFSFAEDGLYPIVTHAFNFVGRGALGLFQAGDGDPLN